MNKNEQSSEKDDKSIKLSPEEKRKQRGQEVAAERSKAVTRRVFAGGAVLTGLAALGGFALYEVSQAEERELAALQKQMESANDTEAVNAAALYIRKKEGITPDPQEQRLWTNFGVIRSGNSNEEMTRRVWDLIGKMSASRIDALKRRAATLSPALRNGNVIITCGAAYDKPSTVYGLEDNTFKTQIDFPLEYLTDPLYQQSFDQVTLLEHEATHFDRILLNSGKIRQENPGISDVDLFYAMNAKYEDNAAERLDDESLAYEAELKAYLRGLAYGVAPSNDLGQEEMAAQFARVKFNEQDPRWRKYLRDNNLGRRHNQVAA